MVAPRFQLEALCALLTWLSSAAWLADGTRAEEAASQPDPGLTAYQTAAGFLQRGLYDLAIPEFQRFLEAHPQHASTADARYGLAVAASRTGDWALVRKQVEAIEAGPSFGFRIESRILLGQALVALSEYERAAEVLKGVLEQDTSHALADDAASLRITALARLNHTIELHRAAAEFSTSWPGSPLRDRVYYEAAAAAVEQGDFPLAAQWCEKLIAAAPQSALVPRTQLLLGQSLRRAGRAKAALPALEQAAGSDQSELSPIARYEWVGALIELEQDDAAARRADEWLERFPDHALCTDLRRQRADLALKLQDVDLAAKLYQLVAGADPQNAAAAQRGLARCELRGGKASDAAKRLTALHEAGERSPGLLYELAAARTQAGQFEQALSVLEGLPAGASEDAPATEVDYLKAYCLARMGRHESCAETCRRFLAEHSESTLSPQVALLWADAALAQQKGAEVIPELERQLKSSTGQAAWRPRVMLKLAQACVQEGRAENARGWLEKVGEGVGLDPGESLAALELSAHVASTLQDWPAAQKRWRQFLEQSPPPDRQPAAWLQLALACRRLGHEGDALTALEHFGDAPLRDELRVRACFERGQCSLALQRLDDADTFFQRVIHEQPDSRWAVEARQHLALLALQRGDAKAAAEDLRRAVEKMEDPRQRAAAQLQLAVAHLQAGKAEEAVTVLEQVDAQQLDAPQRVEATAYHGIALSRAGQCEPSEKALEGLSEAQRAGLSSVLRCTLESEVASCLLRAGNKVAATRAYERLLADKDCEAEQLQVGRLELARLLIEAEEYSKAAMQLRPLLDEPSLDPLRLAEASYLGGLCAFRIRDFAEAEKWLDRACRDGALADAQFSAARLMRGESLMQLGRHAAAIPLLQAVTLGPADPAAWSAAMLRLADAQAQQSDWAGSERSYMEFVRKSPDAPQAAQARFGIGWARENQRKYAEAIAAYRDCLAGRPPTSLAARAQFQIGECLYALRDYSAAVRELLQVDILYQDAEWAAAALYEAGRCFEELNRPTDATQQYDSLLKRFAETKWASLAKTRREGLRSAPPPGRAQAAP